jgi:uncharacterized membrane protein YhaH (DUF805 family)
MSDDNLIGIGLVVVVGAFIYIPLIWFIVRILRRMGFSGWWSLMLVLWPVGLGLLAFVRWPAVDKNSN